ncbi:MAG: PQQ-binding-like beta-propeller repeat protein [Verrucomicrobiales bacterium]
MKMLVLSCAVLTLSPAAVAEWNQFRGPEGTGVAEAALVPAVPTQKDITWTATLPGKGHSSPIAWGEKVFVTAEDGTKSGVRYVLCYSAKDGKELWRYEDQFEAYPQHELNSYTSSTPAADARRLYLSWLSGTERRVLALDHNGKKAWEKTLGFYREQHGSSASPIIVDGLLIVPNDHANKKDAGIYALDAATGAIKWKFETTSDKTAFSTPTLIKAPDGKKQLIISSQPAALTALDPATGKKLWEVSKPVSEARAVSSPVWAQGIIVATVGQGGAGRGAVAVKAGSSDGKVKPEVVWEASSRIPYVPTAVAFGPNLYFLGDGGILSCVKSATGEHVWDERGPGKAYSSPICINGLLYTLSRDGKLLVARAGEKFEPLGELALGEECQTTPAVAAGRLIVRTNTKLIGIGGAPSAEKP